MVFYIEEQALNPLLIAMSILQKRFYLFNTKDLSIVTKYILTHFVKL